MIDARAVIDPAAELDEGVSVGPFSIIEADVQIGAGSEIGPHVVIRSGTRIGRENRIYQFASIGENPQDKKYAGEETFLEIGNRNTIREFSTINRGTAQDAIATRIGDDNLLMAYTHVAHDCQIGNQVIMANAASLGGHVQVQDWAILGGFSIVHQFCRIGAHSFSGMGSVISKDVPSYVTVSGHPAKPYGINSEGLQRRDFSSQDIQAIRRAYKLLYMKGLKLAEAIEQMEQMCVDCPALDVLVQFLRDSKRSILR